LSVEKLTTVVDDGEGDTIFAIDRISEDIVIEHFDRVAASVGPIVLIAEGLAGGKIVLPDGAKKTEAKWRIIVDPIDGTRGLMYQKRSAWVLTGVAPNRGNDTSLRDIEFAIQTEIPLIKQHLADSVWAYNNGSIHAERYDRTTGSTSPLRLCPSTAKTIEQGFAMISRFFPGARDVLAEIDEEMVRAALGNPKAGKAQCFEDQYISTGGQLYELLSGRDRFVADLRPLMSSVMKERGFDLSICCHPYDLCTELIARQAGVIVTNENGERLDAPLSVEGNISWVGYANEDIRMQIEPELQSSLRKRGLIR
jgi:fructose-1,6-bisphosphatase/inositol monophosphatase family enzyme